MQINQANKELLFNYYIKDFKNNNRSIISDFFYSSKCNALECSYCHNKIYNYQTYFIISFPLLFILKFKKEKYMINKQI